MDGHGTRTYPRAEGECVGDGDEENRLMTGSGGEEWGAGAKDRQQTTLTFSQPEQSYEAAFNKVWFSLGWSCLTGTCVILSRAVSHRRSTLCGASEV